MRTVLYVTLFSYVSVFLLDIPLLHMFFLFLHHIDVFYNGLVDKPKRFICRTKGQIMLMYL